MITTPMDYRYPLVSLKFVEDIKMSEYNELKQATKEIEVLKSEIKTLKEQTNFVMNKLEKAIEDRIPRRNWSLCFLAWKWSFPGVLRTIRM